MVQITSILYLNKEFWRILIGYQDIKTYHTKENCEF